jgi:sugar lactone lactonase YvrE
MTFPDVPRKLIDVSRTVFRSPTMHTCAHLLRRSSARLLSWLFALFAATGLAGCGGDVGVAIGFNWHFGDPWPDHPDWPSWPDRPQGATGLFPIAGDTCSQCATTRDGTGADARFSGPQGIAADRAGNLYVAEPASAVIRKITPTGVVSTLAGSPGVIGYADAAGAQARFNAPSRLAADDDGRVYVTDSGNSVIRRVAPDGTVGTVAGNGTCGSADGRGGGARFCTPRGVALDRRGNVWVADTGNHTVRRIDASGNVTTVAGSPGVCGSRDGRGGGAQFCNPQDIGVDEFDNVYIVDTGNSTIRMLRDSGEVTTLAGLAGQCAFNDGASGISRLCSPTGIAIDGDDLYIADTGNATVRRINLDNVTSTVAGVPGRNGIVLGALPGGLDRPAGIALAPDFSLALTTQNMVVKLVPAR